jgi:multidrug efflux pump
MGGFVADESISFQLMRQKATQFLEILRQDPAVESVGGSTRATNYISAFAVLKPLSERNLSVQQVIDRLTLKIDHEIAGNGCWLAAIQDVQLDEHGSQYQYTLLSDNIEDIFEWAPKVEAALKNVPLLKGVFLHQQQHGLETNLIIDRSAAARLGLIVSQIDNTLYDAFGQRQISTIYAAQNQYHVVMEVAPQFWRNRKSYTRSMSAPAAARSLGRSRLNG